MFVCKSLFWKFSIAYNTVHNFCDIFVLWVSEHENSKNYNHVDHPDYHKNNQRFWLLEYLHVYDIALKKLNILVEFQMWNVLDQLLKFKHFQFLHPLKYEANLSNVQKYMKIIRKFKRKLLAISLGLKKLKTDYFGKI